MPVESDVKQWLMNHGVWTAFWKRRDEHKAAGDTPADAQRKALAEFHRPESEPAVAQAQAGTSSDGGD